MISLRQLVVEAFPDYISPERIPELPVAGLECDSRKIRKGDVFIAIQGKKADGRNFIQDALTRGAAAIISENAAVTPIGVPWVGVADDREAVARLASAFYRFPSRSMKMVGVTGTNGKTTTTYLIERILTENGRPCGVLGTINYRFGAQEIAATETTPGPLRCQEIFRRMKDAGCDHVAMEVSSHALDQNRVGGIRFDAAVFTNLTQDHLDYHGDLEHYFLAKAKLFESLDGNAFAIINGDDPRGKILATKTRARVITYGFGEGLDARAERVVYGAQDTRFDWVRGGKRTPVILPLAGLFNVYNALGALETCVALGVEPEKAARSLAEFSGVPGRLEPVRCGQDFSVLVDFAHTPDGLLNVLTSLSAAKKNKLYLVFGCGGDRDKTKRPVMAEIASRFADFVYVTSDNPRSEDPKTIAQEVSAGFPADYKKYRVVLDRSKAIREALLAARRDDVVLLAGKGHEKTQIIGDRVLPFNDRQEAERILHGF